MIDRKSKIDSSETTPVKAGQKTISKIQPSSVLNKAENLLIEMDLLSEYYSIGLGEPEMSFELSSMVEEAIERFPGDKEQALKHLAQELHRVDKIIDKYAGDKEALIQILLDINSLYHWLPKSSLFWVSTRLNVPLAQIYHIGSFYKAFSLVPQGRHLIQVCLGTACQVRNAPRLLDKIISAIKIAPMETDKELKFTLKTVNCLGCCALGPVMMIDDDTYSNPSQEQLEKIMANYK
jgi:NADH-quinone oxidoreductase subunit E